MNVHRDTKQLPHHVAKGRFQALWQQIGNGKEHSAGFKKLINFSIKKKIPLQTVSTDVLDHSMNSSFKKFIDGKYLMPDLINTARNIGEARKMLVTHDNAMRSLSKGKILLATVEGEHHRHGKDIVTSLLRGIGFNTIDLGLGVPLEDIVMAVKRHTPDYLGISASILTTIPKIKKLKKCLEKDEGVRKTKVIIGGYIAKEESSKSIGAEHYCKNTTQTISLLKALSGIPADRRPMPIPA
jgi:5-methyltetrahydrofolate--homocysteine methyltransferase